MLKVRGIISSFFQLVLRVPSKLAPNAIYKGLGVNKVLLEEGFELRLRDWNNALVIIIVLSQTEADGATEEGGGKWSTIHPCDTESF